VSDSDNIFSSPGDHLGCRHNQLSAEPSSMAFPLPILWFQFFQAAPEDLNSRKFQKNGKDSLHFLPKYQ
jgi:hypothetical protein